MSKTQQAIATKGPTSSRSTSPGEKLVTRRMHAVALAIILIATALVRIHLLSVPLERDEGEYAYMGNLLLHGGLPYRDAYNMKLPGTYAAYSLFIGIFGSSPEGVHTGFLLVSLLTIALLYLTLKRLFNARVASAASLVYALLSVSRPMLGLAAHATHFVNLFVVGGLYLHSRWNEESKWRNTWFTGLLFGFAFLMKQQALFLVLFGALAVAIRRWARGRSSADRKISPAAAGIAKATLRDVAVYSSGAALPYATLVIVMLAAGAFDRFWFWTVTYASQYASADTSWPLIQALFQFSFGPMFTEYPVVWLLAAAGLTVVWLHSYTLEQKLLATLLALCSVAALVPGLNFREHYFVVLLPAVGLLAAICLDKIVLLIKHVTRNAAVEAIPLAVILVMGIVAVSKDRGYYFTDNPQTISKTVYAGNPFVEAAQIGDYIARNTSATDKIAVIGSEPEFLVSAGRQSATGYLYVYPLLEPQPYNVTMQREMIDETEKAAPSYLIYCNVVSSWAARPDSPQNIIEWLRWYAPRHYDIVGVVELSADTGPSAFYWDAEARSRPPRPNAVYILKRKQS